MIKISICMIVKNEEKNIYRCLNSLKPIMSLYKTELIIVDTGSEDSTVDICKTFTNHVYSHPWSGNFSEMRNISLTYAKGEWLFIVDADEEVVEFSALENDIFESANTILVKIRNYTNLNDRRLYFDVVSPRFFRNHMGFKFEGSIHNQPLFFAPTRTTTHIEMAHYGYDSSNRDLMLKKYNRTKAMLEKEIDKNPEDVYFLFQLSTTYQMIQNYEKSFEMIKKAWDIIENSKEFEAYFYAFKQYIVAMKNLSMNSNAKQVMEFHRDLVSKDPDMCYYLADSYDNSELYEEAVIWYQKYLDLISIFSREGKLFQATSNKIDTQIFEPMVQKRVGKCFVKYGNTEEALNHFQKMDLLQMDKETLDMYLKLVFEKGDMLLLKTLSEQIISSENEGLLNVFLRQIYIRIVRDNQGIEVMASKASPHIEFLFRVKTIYQSNQFINPEELRKYFITNYSFDKIFISDLIYYAIHQNTPIGDLILDISSAEFMSILEFLFELHSDFIETMIKLIENSSLGINIRQKLLIEKFLLDSTSLDMVLFEAIGIDYLINLCVYALNFYKNEFLESTSFSMCNFEINVISELIRCIDNKEDFNKTLLKLKQSSETFKWYIPEVHLNEVYDMLDQIIDR